MLRGRTLVFSKVNNVVQEDTTWEIGWTENRGLQAIRNPSPRGHRRETGKTQRAEEFQKMKSTKLEERTGQDHKNRIQENTKKQNRSTSGERKTGTRDAHLYYHIKE